MAQRMRYAGVSQAGAIGGGMYGRSSGSYPTRSREPGEGMDDAENAGQYDIVDIAGLGGQDSDKRPHTQPEESELIFTLKKSNVKIKNSLVVLSKFGC